jgi:hypothetical protein
MAASFDGAEEHLLAQLASARAHAEALSIQCAQHAAELDSLRQLDKSHEQAHNQLLADYEFLKRQNAEALLGPDMPTTDQYEQLLEAQPDLMTPATDDAAVQLKQTMERLTHPQSTPPVDQQHDALTDNILKCITVYHNAALAMRFKGMLNFPGASNEVQATLQVSIGDQ